jgi:hypothetical protein
VTPLRTLALLVPGAAHQDLHAYAPADYERRVLAFLSKALRTQQEDTR